MNIKKLVLVLVIVLAGLLAISFYLVNASKDYKSLAKQLKVSHIIYNADKALPEFSLVDHNNDKFDNNSLKGKWSLILFIYTHCPDVCPTELFNMSRLKHLIAKDKKTTMPDVVAITFDPLRDTPEVMKKYITNFDKDFVGISGDQAQIDKFIKPFGTYYERVVYGKNTEQIILKAKDKLPENALKEGYFINHTAWVYLLNPEGQIFAGFSSPHKPSLMAEDIKRIVNF